MRSANGRVWSCQGASPSSPSASGSFAAGNAPDISAADSAGDSGVTALPSTEIRPAKKPLSQARCSGVNGALSGSSESGCGRRCEAHDTSSGANICLSAAIVVAAREGQEGLVLRGAPREIGLEHALDGGRRVVALTSR